MKKFQYKTYGFSMKLFRLTFNININGSIIWLANSYDLLSNGCLE